MPSRVNPSNLHILFVCWHAGMMHQSVVFIDIESVWLPTLFSGEVQNCATTFEVSRCAIIVYVALPFQCIASEGSIGVIAAC